MKWSAVAVMLCAIAFLGSGPAGAAGVTGVVQAVSLASRTVGVRSGKQVITFDAKIVQLKGYKTLGEVSRGDTVAAAYAASGLRITKIKAATGGTAAQVRAARGSVRRLVSGQKGNSFDDADENNDGRISPVELSTVVPDLTLQKFKDHDGDGDGYLSRREFESLWPGR